MATDTVSLFEIEDLLIEILAFLPVSQILLACAPVSSFWRDASYSDNLWLKLCRRDLFQQPDGSEDSAMAFYKRYFSVILDPAYKHASLSLKSVRSGVEVRVTTYKNEYSPVLGKHGLSSGVLRWRMQIHDNKSGNTMLGVTCLHRADVDQRTVGSSPCVCVGGGSVFPSTLPSTGSISGLDRGDVMAIELNLTDPMNPFVLWMPIHMKDNEIETRKPPRRRQPSRGTGLVAGRMKLVLGQTWYPYIALFNGDDAVTLLNGTAAPPFPDVSNYKVVDIVLAKQTEEYLLGLNEDRIFLAHSDWKQPSETTS